MSIQNLLTPNNYNIYANTITTNDINDNSFLPNLTEGVNVSPESLTPVSGYFTRIKNIVYMSCVFEYTPVIASFSTILIDLPVERENNFIDANESIGPGWQRNGTSDTILGFVSAEVGEKKILYKSPTLSGTGFQTVYITCSYKLV